jgi:hypothetical protein
MRCSFCICWLGSMPPGMLVSDGPPSPRSFTVLSRTCSPAPSTRPARTVSYLMFASIVWRMASNELSPCTSLPDVVSHRSSTVRIPRLVAAFHSFELATRLTSCAAASTWGRGTWNQIGSVPAVLGSMKMCSQPLLLNSLTPVPHLHIVLCACSETYF